MNWSKSAHFSQGNVMNVHTASRLALASLLLCSWCIMTSFDNLPKPSSNQGFALVELFTSQGCSSCPSADALLQQLTNHAEARKQAVFTLSFHVDYWNHLGWKDPYSSKAFSDRQRRYAQALRTESIYTPQMIINGQTEFVGSSKNEAESSLQKALQATPDMHLQVSAKAAQNLVRVEYMCSALPQNAAANIVLNIALVRDVEPLAVNAGENSGRKLSHTHIVRTFETITIAQISGTKEVRAPQDFPSNRTQYRMIAYLQDNRTMRVLAATMSAIE